MNDVLLSSLREEPRPELVVDLKRRLDAIEDEALVRPAPRSTWMRMRPALATLAAAATLVVLFSMPAVRASARSFLEVFRVQRFATVRVDNERLERLHARHIDLKSLVSDQVEILEDPGEPEVVADVTAAEERTGMRVAQPSVLPRGSALSSVHVSGVGHVRATVDMGRIEALAEAMEIDGLEIPENLDGSQVELRTAPAVMLRYTRGKDSFNLFQARSPEIGVPDGVDIENLGALGLQLAGMSPEEARIFAAKLDWRTTLLVPVPAFGADFRDVTVRDAQGLLVTARERRGSGGGAVGRGEHHRETGWHSVLLWAQGDEVFALTGPGRGFELLEMAGSIG